MSDSNFLNRWAKRKAESKLDSPHVDTVMPAPQADALPVADAAPQDSDKPVPATVSEASEELSPLPTMADVADLTPSSDFTRFMQVGVDPSTRNAAMKALFKDPHFNVMDMMDIYVDDYSKPDPIPLELLKTLRQSMDLGLFSEAKPEETASREQAVAEPIEELPAVSATNADPELENKTENGAESKSG